MALYYGKRAMYTIYLSQSMLSPSLIPLVLLNVHTTNQLRGADEGYREFHSGSMCTKSHAA